MGFPTDMFPVLFCIPRTAGWLAHWVREDGKGAACSFVWVVRLCAFVCGLCGLRGLCALCAFVCVCEGAGVCVGCEGCVFVCPFKLSRVWLHGWA